MERVGRAFSLLSIGLLILIILVFTREYTPDWKGEQAIAGLPWREGLYEENCGQCHGAVGQGRASGRAPAIANLDFLATASDEYLMQTIKYGREGTNMSAHAMDQGGVLSEKLIQAIIDELRYRQAYEPPPRDALAVNGSVAQGEKLYDMYCSQCHGAYGQGRLGPALNNAQFLASAGDSFLRNTISKGRQETPMPAYGQGHGGQLQLNEQEIDDLIIFLRSWSVGVKQK